MVDDDVVVVPRTRSLLAGLDCHGGCASAFLVRSMQRAHNFNKADALWPQRAIYLAGNAYYSARVLEDTKHVFNCLSKAYIPHSGVSMLDN